MRRAAAGARAAPQAGEVVHCLEPCRAQRPRSSGASGYQGPAPRSGPPRGRSSAVCAAGFRCAARCSVQPFLRAHDLPQGKGPSSGLLSAWGAKKAETETAIKMLTTYKDLGDVAEEVRRGQPGGALAAAAAAGSAGCWQRRRQPRQRMICAVASDCILLAAQWHRRQQQQRFVSDLAKPRQQGLCLEPSASDHHTTPHSHATSHPPPCHPQPYLKHHNPRTFEDMSKAIPNFKKFGLKAGEVPRFFDNVLQVRRRVWFCRGWLAGAEGVKGHVGRGAALLYYVLQVRRVARAAARQKPAADARLPLSSFPRRAPLTRWRPRTRGGRSAARRCRRRSRSASSR